MMNSWDCLLSAAVMAGFIILVSANTNNTVCVNNSDAQHLDGPIISPCRSEIILQMGQNVTLSCKGKTELNFKQQDIPEELIGPFSMQQRVVPSSDSEYKYEIALDLYNVDQFAIGYYACFDNSVNASAILNNLIDEPNNTEHVSYIYVYVDGSNILFAPMREVVIPRCSMFVIECRPSTPDVIVTLSASQSNKTPEIVKFSPKIGFLTRTCRSARCQGQRGNHTQWKYIRNVAPPTKPIVKRAFFDYDEWRYLEGETFYLNCTVNFTPPALVILDWIIPPNAKKPYEESNAYNLTGGVLYRSIRIENATNTDEGSYTCISRNNCGRENTTIQMKYLGDLAVITLKHGNGPQLKLRSTRKMVRLNAEIHEAYPPLQFQVLKNNQSLTIDQHKINLSRDSRYHAAIDIRNLTLTDTGNYTLVATNKYKTSNITFDLSIMASPIIHFNEKECMENSTLTLACHVTGNPLPDIYWSFENEQVSNTLKSNKIEVKSLYEETAFLNINCMSTGNITCHASNRADDIQVEKFVTQRLLVYEMPNGFGIKNSDTTMFSEYQNVTLECLATKYKFNNVEWLGGNDEDLSAMENITLEYSNASSVLIAKLIIKQISLNDAGTYRCYGVRINGTVEMNNITISVTELLPLQIRIPADNKIEEVSPFQKIQLNCQADSVPPPRIEWYKDDILFINGTDKGTIFTNIVNFTTVNSTIFIDNMQEEKTGKYECIAFNDMGEARKLITVALKAEQVYTTYLIAVAVVMIALILLVGYLTLKIKKEKQFRKELAAAGLLYFKEGATKSLNPDLGIDEQAELLPYDERFEYPPEKLKLGTQLGAGAFGVVFKAEARGIINAEEVTPVAVKMVKKTADNMYIKALISELKIMVHLGKHINIVNLLGACTKNVGKRELMVIVEYCKFGNIHNYMQRHREVFIDQLTDNNEKNLGKVNRAFSCTSGGSGTQSDYFGSTNTQDTDHTFLATANTNRSGRKVSEGYVKPEWRTDYESDYSFDGRNPRPLTSRDLLAWAFQIARGMEYLASRKVLHGDLAARNILLAEDNIVKICDFGLARSIYKNDEYQKKENSPLPVKWLAIECMTDRIFSTQSDVWSFGVVLWELFSLAKTPYPNYPNISPPNLLYLLSQGLRMEKPPYADDRLYDVMKRCWEQKPTARPSFTQLQEILGNFLEDNVRNRYVDLNAPYMDLNARPVGEDYLAMVSAPDYNTLVTPSPHHYVNDARSFFPPTPTKIDEEGYLQMSPARNQSVTSPRPQGTKFDFDARKFNPRESDASSCGSELTPMLTLTNLPARSGSESDHEGNVSPYLNMCPRIEEETDDVFEVKQNNAKNVQNSAVTNPSYITFDMDVVKKPKDNINDYANVIVHAPNGLVK